MKPYAVLEDTKTLTSTDERQLYTHKMICSKVYIYAETYDVYIGRKGSQNFLLYPVGFFDRRYAAYLEWVDLSTIYVRAATANAKIHILGFTVDKEII